MQPLQPLTAILDRLRTAAGAAAARPTLLRDAAGLVLAEDLAVDADVPPGAVALEAGYAVRASDLVGVGAYSPLHLTVMPPWVAAGDRLPPGCDAVVPASAVAVHGASFEVVASLAPGENVRRAGEEARTGERLRLRGEILRPRDIAAAMAAGLTSATVAPVMVTGYADAEAGAVLAPLLEAVRGARSRVDPLPAGLEWAEGIVLIASHDGTARDRLAESGEVLASGLALRCSERVTVGLVGQTPVIVAPPRFDALVVLALALIRPLADAMTGRTDGLRWRAPLTRKLSSGIGFVEIALVQKANGGLDPLCVGTATPSALARADGYVIIPPESEGFQAGALVDAHGF